jgi:hypothetical protein
MFACLDAVILEFGIGSYSYNVSRLVGGKKKAEMLVFTAHTGKLTLTVRISQANPCLLAGGNLRNLCCC